MIPKWVRELEEAAIQEHQMRESGMSWFDMGTSWFDMETSWFDLGTSWFDMGMPC